TRTYAAQSGSEFAHLVKDLNGEQLALIDTIKTGVRYTDYHVQMHQRIAKL
ncbi:Xaa-Pro dipeptidase, partial [Klebsiella pneumoniae]